VLRRHLLEVANLVVKDEDLDLLLYFLLHLSSSSLSINLPLSSFLKVIIMKRKNNIRERMESDVHQSEADDPS